MCRKMLRLQSMNGGSRVLIYTNRSDRNQLLDGKKLNDALINACQKLLSQQFPKVAGFEDTIRDLSSKFTLKEFALRGVQILLYMYSIVV